MYKSKNCVITYLDNGLVRVESGKFKVTVLEDRVSRYVEDYEMRSVSESKNPNDERAMLKEKCRLLGITVKGSPSAETLKKLIKKKEEELKKEEEE